MSHLTALTALTALERRALPGERGTGRAAHAVPAVATLDHVDADRRLVPPPGRDRVVDLTQDRAQDLARGLGR
ncbi:hypothetical protein [Kineococcus arenarius]|uniref:hypothetical protein n=1 Tax=Kineococcus sp. SYSU DK007 TaxID=3383128 RepID=UPI003D7EA850